MESKIIYKSVSKLSELNGLIVSISNMEDLPGYTTISIDRNLYGKRSLKNIVNGVCFDNAGY